MYPTQSLRARPASAFVALLLLILALTFVLAGCDSGTPAATATPIEPTATVTPLPTAVPTDTEVPSPTPLPTDTALPTATVIPVSERMKTYVPILCYHHIRDWVTSDTGDDKAYIMPPARFEKTLQYLKDKGYTGVTAPQVYDFYANGKPLPPNPVMLSFDDNNVTQYTNGLPLLKKYGFNATFFIMTVTIDNENYMTGDQLKELDKEGFDVEPHTWDHHMVTRYATDADWQLQIVKPKKDLEALLGHPTPFFAYPFGIYDAASAEKIKSYGYKAAFSLNQLMDDQADPLFRIRRYIANPYFTTDQLDAVLAGTW